MRCDALRCVLRAAPHLSGSFASASVTSAVARARNASAKSSSQRSTGAPRTSLHAVVQVLSAVSADRSSSSNPKVRCEAAAAAHAADGAAPSAEEMAPAAANGPPRKGSEDMHSGKPPTVAGQIEGRVPRTGVSCNPVQNRLKRRRVPRGRLRPAAKAKAQLGRRTRTHLGEPRPPPQGPGCPRPSPRRRGGPCTARGGRRRTKRRRQRTP